MSSNKSSDGANGTPINPFAEIMRAIESRDWDTLDRLVGMSPEEAERILREEPTIDGEEFKRLMEEADRDEEKENAAQGIDVGKACQKPA